MQKTICELFAGVGGFREGFEAIQRGWKTVWFSQWEPGAVRQWAHENYVNHYGNSTDENGEYHTCEDIAEVNKSAIPDHTLLVGGFPCQDYSILRPLSEASGIEGKKGVLWWSIIDVITAKQPPFCLFENVDHLLLSPKHQRGRDFGIILSSLNSLGYDSEWQIVNSADFGSAQCRKRLFIFAFSRKTKYYHYCLSLSPEQLITNGMMSRAFPCSVAGEATCATISDDVAAVSSTFSFRFLSAGIMRNGSVYTTAITPICEPQTPLSSILDVGVAEQFYYSDYSLERLRLYKSAKRELRTKKDGTSYFYSEGKMAFPDQLDRPSRTLVTTEGTVSRTSHVICDPQTGRMRRLTPLECERLQGFPDGWTVEMPQRMRYKVMGNALVVQMITRMAQIIDAIVEAE